MFVVHRLNNIYCKYCNQTKPESCFYPSLIGKKWGECKVCRLARQTRYLSTEKGRSVAKLSRQRWRKTDRGKLLVNEQARRYRATDKGKAHWKKYANSEKGKATRKNWQDKNKDRIREVARTYYQTESFKIKRKLRPSYNNRQKINQRMGLYYANNPMARLNASMRNSIYSSLTGRKNGHRWTEIVGYDISKLKRHLESKFSPGMTWENYGKWHIDHIQPVASFNFDSYNHPEFKKCWALSNLQPLWAIDNMRKHTRRSLWN